MNSALAALATFSFKALIAARARIFYSKMMGRISLVAESGAGLESSHGTGRDADDRAR
jgi:hypothetical protein